MLPTTLQLNVVVVGMSCAVIMPVIRNCYKKEYKNTTWFSFKALIHGCGLIESFNMLINSFMIISPSITTQYIMKYIPYHPHILPTFFVEADRNTIGFYMVIGACFTLNFFIKECYEFIFKQNK